MSARRFTRGVASTQRLAVVVPARDEAHGIVATLEALRDQQDTDFDLVVVDNGSSDGTGDLVRATAAAWGMTRWRVVDEPRKGTGAAADTGMRAAIAQGATHLARTDADCLPLPDWTRRVRARSRAGTTSSRGASCRAPTTARSRASSRACSPRR